MPIRQRVDYNQPVTDDPAQEPSKRNWLSFWSLMGLQAQNAFNDKALQYTLLPLGVWVASVAGAGWGGSFAHVLGALILFPFILFAPLAGWAGDRFSKTRVIRLTAWMQLVVLGVVLFCFGQQLLAVAVMCFFFLALQSTILSPAKLGIIKELVGSPRLGFASGVMEMFTIVAILAGQIVVGFWFKARHEALGDGWEAGMLPMMVIASGAVVTLVLAYSIEVTPAQSKKPFRASMLFSHFTQLKDLFRDRPLRLSALGVAYFWWFGAIVQLVSIQIALELYEKGDPTFASSVSWMMMAAGGGIAVGSIMAATINKRHIELGLTPLGGFIMAVATILLVFTDPESFWFYTWLAAAGFGAAFFFVPVNAYLQDECDPSQRGNTLAGSNLLNCLAMLFGVILQLVMMQVFHLSWEVQFFIIGLTAIAATWYVMKLLPRAFVKLLVMSALRAFYRIDPINADRMPKEGGVLLTPNHVSYLDALILTAASPRPVRFLMVRSYFKRPLVGAFARLFDTIPISETRAKDAIRVAAESLQEGNVVCIFPEGQLSRTGFLSEIKKGFGLIARRAKAQVQPVYLDGLWQSIFSAERGKFFFKKPRAVPFGVRVPFGEPRDGKGCSAANLRDDLHNLAMVALEHRLEASDDVASFLDRIKGSPPALRWWNGKCIQSASWREVRSVVAGSLSAETVAKGHRDAQEWLEGWKEMAALPAEEWRRMLLNAQQLAEPHDLGLGKGAVAIDAAAPVAVRKIWGALLPALVRTSAVLVDRENGETAHREFRAAGIAIQYVVGTAAMEPFRRAADQEGEELPWYRFDGDESGYLCAEMAGRIVSLSIPNPPLILSEHEEEPGAYEGSVGRLLTGFMVDEREGEIRLSGQMLEREVILPAWKVDARGFLWPPLEVRE